MKIFSIITYSILVWAALTLESCRVYDIEPIEHEPYTPRPLPESDDFTFSVYESLSLTLFVGLDSVTPYQGAKVVLLSEELQLLQNGVTNDIGEFLIRRTVHSAMARLGITLSAIGFPSDTLWFELSGQDQITITPDSYGQSSLTLFKKKTSSLGLPSSLAEDVTISSALLEDINNAFPERSRVDIDHPEYIHHGNESELSIVNDSADVWITFIHEGAGYKNSFGYFTYPDSAPPPAASSLELIPIFPNASYSGSGGGLSTGNTVSIGRFPPGTRIGFWIIANGWENNAINWNGPTYFSERDFNPEQSDSARHHLASLYHPDYDMIILAFEDINRESSGCDHDFNDIIFTASWNPVTAINVEHIFEVPSSVDTDNDGITDNNDDFPNDPDKAFTIHTPALGAFGLLAYEDLYPRMGDYDFNDVVLSYSMSEVTNAALEISSIDGTLVANASGAHLKNGFAISFGNIPDPESWSISGTFTTLDSRLERGTSGELLFIITDDYKSLFRGHPLTMVNTFSNAPHIDGDTLTFSFQFSAPVTLPVPPYNPFIFRTDGEELEVHLPYYAPTYRFDSSLFGRKDDNSTPETGRYFMNTDNMPWAVHTGPNWLHPKETRNIGAGYTYFNSWVDTDGSTFRDWERNGRDVDALYLKHE
ncbi:MAG: LruC domain-containing protein [Fibrobacterales bacterium]